MTQEAPRSTDPREAIKGILFSAAQAEEAYRSAIDTACRDLRDNLVSYFGQLPEASRTGVLVVNGFNSRERQEHDGVSVVMFSDGLYYIPRDRSQYSGDYMRRWQVPPNDYLKYAQNAYYAMEQETHSRQPVPIPHTYEPSPFEDVFLTTDTFSVTQEHVQVIEDKKKRYQDRIEEKQEDPGYKGGIDRLNYAIAIISSLLQKGSVSMIEFDKEEWHKVDSGNSDDYQNFQAAWKTVKNFATTGIDLRIPFN